MSSVGAQSGSGASSVSAACTPAVTPVPIAAFVLQSPPPLALVQPAVSHAATDPFVAAATQFPPPGTVPLMPAAQADTPSTAAAHAVAPSTADEHAPARATAPLTADAQQPTPSTSPATLPVYPSLHMIYVPPTAITSIDEDVEADDGGGDGAEEPQPIEPARAVPYDIPAAGSGQLLMHRGRSSNVLLLSSVHSSHLAVCCCVLLRATARCCCSGWASASAVGPRVRG